MFHVVVQLPAAGQIILLHPIANELVSVPGIQADSTPGTKRPVMETRRAMFGEPHDQAFARRRNLMDSQAKVGKLVHLLGGRPVIGRVAALNDMLSHAEDIIRLHDHRCLRLIVAVGVINHIMLHQPDEGRTIGNRKTHANSPLKPQLANKSAESSPSCRTPGVRENRGAGAG